MNKDLLEGVFVEEDKTRFSCVVQIGDKREKCYVASSCKLEKLIPLKNKKVLVKRIQSNTSDMKNSLFAVKGQQGWVLLNLAEANRIVERQLSERKFSYLGKRKLVEREKQIEGYKSDLFLQESNTVIEVKTILSDKRENKFPSVKSSRVNKQLMQILQLLEKGYRVCYLFVALNSITKQVEIADDLKEIFSMCIDRGMICKGYSIKFVDEEPVLHGLVKVIF